MAGLCLLTLPPGLSLLPTLLSMKDNYLFLKEVKNLVEKTNCELKVCFQYMNRGDRWIQVRPPGWEGRGSGLRQEGQLSVSTLAASCSARVNSMSDHACACAQGYKRTRRLTAAS